MANPTEEIPDSIVSPHPHSLASTTEQQPQKHVSASSSPYVTRQWKPAAQRNLRNQWSKLASFKHQWVSLSSSARSHATSIVNAYLSQRYMPAMELGILFDMPNIRKKACSKLFKKQELHKRTLLSFYKDMVGVVKEMINTARSMRCFLKGTSNSPLVQFSLSSEDKNDAGDGEGIPVFKFWSISTYESLAQELVQMFALELNLRRLLVMELVSVYCEEASQVNDIHWSNELYPGEFDDFRVCNLYSDETCEPTPPRINSSNPKPLSLQYNHHQDREVLQVYLTTWLAEVHVDTYRVDEIFNIIGDEMGLIIS